MSKHDKSGEKEDKQKIESFYEEKCVELGKVIGKGTIVDQLKQMFEDPPYPVEDMSIKLVLNILGKLKEADLQPLYDGLSNEEGLVLLKCVYKAWNYIREYPELDVSKICQPAVLLKIHGGLVDKYGHSILMKVMSDVKVIYPRMSNSESVSDSAYKAASDAYTKSGSIISNLRESYPDYFILALILIGILLLFFGLKLFRPSLGIIAACFFWAFRARFLPMDFDVQNDSTYFYLTLGMTVLMGLLAWYLVDVGIIILGLACGGSVGYSLFIWFKAITFAFLHQHLQFEDSPNYEMLMMLIVVILFAVIGALFINKMVDPIMIGFSGILGSFLLAVGSFVGNVPNWEKLPEIFIRLEFAALNNYCYAYIGIVVILALLGGYFQYNNYYGKREPDCGDKED